MTHFSPGLKLLLLFLMMLAATILFSLIMGITGWYFFGTFEFDPALFMEYPGVFKFLQSIQTVLIFIVPAMIAAKLFWPESLDGLAGEGKISLNLLLASGVTMALSQYFIVWTGVVNSHIVLPESWSVLTEWIERTEKEAMELTKALIQYNSSAGFFLNIIIIALLPAMGEEWIFRGHVQRYFSEWFKNIHVAIFLTAFIFSAMHLQFMTFLPRFFLGIILGYLFYLGGNLWYAVAGHFTNNFLALMVMRHHAPDVGPDMSLPDIHFSAGVVISALAVVAMLFLISRVKHGERSRGG